MSFLWFSIFESRQSFQSDRSYKKGDVEGDLTGGKSRRKVEATKSDEKLSKKWV